MKVYVIHYDEENFWGTGIEYYGVEAVLANKECAEKLAGELNEKYPHVSHWVEEFEVQGL